MRIHLLYFLVGCLSLTALTSCDSNGIHEEYVNYDDGNWYYDSTAVFEFEIKNTAVPYNIYYNVRNNLDYPYHNLYVKYALADTAGTQLKADMHQSMLMEAKTGAPFGDRSNPKGVGIGVTYNHQIPVIENYRFGKEGIYRFELQQYMRQDTLSGIYGVGIRVEIDHE